MKCESTVNFVQGPIVGLRVLGPADVPQWAAWFNTPAVTSHLNKGAFPNTQAAQAEFLDRLSRSRNDVQLGIVDQTASLIGIVGLHHIDWVHRHGDISIVVGETAAHGRGVATEAIGLMVRHAFLKLNLHKLTAGMWATNTGSRRAFERNGFQLEGTLRQSFWHGDRFVDEIRLGLLRAEWETRA